MGSKKEISVLRKLLKKLDGWTNVLTNLGITGRDKRMSAEPEVVFLQQQEVESFYQVDDMAARIIDRPVEDMLREGFEIKVVDMGEKGEEAAIAARKVYDSWDLDVKLEKALKWSRLYGSGGILIGIEKQKQTDPLDLENIPKIDFLTPIDRWRMSPDTSSLVREPADPAFGMVAYYALQQVDTKAIQEADKIHHTRFIRFDGVSLPQNLLSQNSYWGDSVLSRLANALRNYQTGYDSAATLIQDFALAVFKLKDLSDMIAQGKESLVTARLELVAKASSIVNAIVIENEEEYDRKSTNVAGLADLLKKMGDRLVAATDIPHTILFGESPSGLGATGESEIKNYYDHIKNQQHRILEPALKQLFDVIFASKDGPTNGNVPDYIIEFNSLWQMDLKEDAEIRKLMAEADERYINVGVLSPVEVAESRFTPEGYSIETQLDNDTRKELDNQNDEGSEE